MIATCPNPQCRTSYTVTPENINRLRNCKRCGTPMQLDGAAPAPAPESAPLATGSEGSVPPPLPANVGTGFLLPTGLTERLAPLQRLADNATWLFAAGLFLVVVFNVLPQIDRAKVARREAAVVLGEVREKRLEEEFKKKESPSADDKEKREKAKERWARDKAELEEDLEDAEMARRRWPYWYRYGMLFGLVLLGAGALAFIRPNEPPVRRILGCIVIAAIVLSFVGGLRIDLGGS